MIDIQIIIDRLRKKYGELTTKNNKKYFEEFPDLKDFCEKLFKENRHLCDCFEDVCFAVYHGIFRPVKCGNEECNNYLTFRNSVRKKYCSHKCGSSKSSQIKREKTCLEKYGTKTPLTNSEIRKKIKETCLQKFGNSVFAGSDLFKEKVKTPFFSKEIQNRAKKQKLKNMEKIMQK